MKSRHCVFSKAKWSPDVPDVPDQFREKRTGKTRPSGNGLDKTVDSNPELQRHDKMQGPKEELW